MLVGTHIETTFDLIEGNVQWLLLDFGRRLGRYEQARLAGDIAGLQTDRAFQTVANDVAIAYYSVLRSQALRRTAQDAFRRAEEELADARKRQREGVVEREIVLRSEVQRAENLQQLHAATEAEFVALAELNLAIGLKGNQPVRVADPTEVPPLATSLADCLQTAIRERREFEVVRRTVQIAVEGGRVARADFAPKVVANGTLLNFQQQARQRPRRFALSGSSGSSGRSSRAAGRSPRPAWRTRRYARPWPRPSRSPIISRFRSTRPTGMPSRPGSASTMRARLWSRRPRITGSCDCDSARVRPRPRRLPTRRPR